jgi:hypothetical protein
LSEQLWNYVLISGAALAGVLARMGQWRKPDETVDWGKALGECAAVPAMTFIVSGGVAWMAPDLDIRVVAALSALCGIIGAAGIEAAAVRLINRRIDG